MRAHLRCNYNLEIYLVVHRYINEGTKGSRFMRINGEQNVLKIFFHLICDSRIMRFFRGNKKRINGELSVHTLLYNSFIGSLKKLLDLKFDTI